MILSPGELVLNALPRIEFRIYDKGAKVRGTKETNYANPMRKRAKKENDHAEQKTMIGTIHKSCPSTYIFSERTAPWAKNKEENGN